MVNSNIHVWHIGARGGYTPFEFPPQLDQTFHITFFDEIQAEPSSVSVGTAGRFADTKIRFIPEIIWSERGLKQFRSALCPFASSLKPFNEKYSNWFVFGNPNVDYLLGIANETIDLTTLKVESLDKIDLTEQWPAPNVIIIDAQGASWEILSGGKEIILNNLDFVMAEVELIPFFDDEPSFGKVMNGLLEHGLIFAKFLKQENPWAHPIRVPLGRRSSPLMGSADAIFIRDPALITNSKDLTRRIKYIITSLCFGFVDIATHIIAETPYWRDAIDQIEPQCMELLVELEECLKKMPAIFPQAIGETGIPISDLQLSFFEEISTPLEDFLMKWNFIEAATDVRIRRIQHLETLRKTL